MVHTASDNGKEVVYTHIPVENVPAKRNKLTQCYRPGDPSAHLQDDRLPLIDTHMSFG